jgi:hypothetical protein
MIHSPGPKNFSLILGKCIAWPEELASNTREYFLNFLNQVIIAIFVIGGTWS